MATPVPAFPMPRPVPQPVPVGRNAVAAAAAAPPPPVADLPQALLPVTTFWQKPWVQDVLPFVTSLFVHAVILLLAIAAAAVVVKARQQVVEEQTIIPESTMADAGPPGGVPNVGTGSDPLKQAMQNTTPDNGAPEGWANRVGRLDAAIAAQGGGAGEAETAAPIGFGVTGLGAGKGLGSGAGNNAGGGAGEGAGPLAMFGTPGGGGIGPKGPMFGNGGNARRIAFVCDGSGSMLNKMASLKNELNKAVQNLKIIQSFNIIFFQEDSLKALNSDALVAASSDAKRKANNFFDIVTPAGGTNPIPGIRLAIKQQPELMYLLTDGDFPNNDAVLAEIRVLNKDKKVKINTIAFVSNSDTDVAFIDLLKTIAQENGGTFKHISENELNQ